MLSTKDFGDTLEWKNPPCITSLYNPKNIQSAKLCASHSLFFSLINIAICCIIASSLRRWYACSVAVVMGYTTGWGLSV